MNKNTPQRSPSPEISGDIAQASEAVSVSVSAAVAKGSELLLEADAPATLIDALTRTARQQPEHGVTYIRADGSERFQSYPDLMDEALHLLSGLRNMQLPPQAKIIFQFDDNADFLPAFWGCILGGYVPVPIAVPPVFESGNAVVEKLLNAWRLLKSPIIFTSESSADQFRSIFQQANLESCRIVSIESLRECPAATVLNESLPDDLAVLLLTSGSTGTPKGVMLTHRNILSNVAASAQVNNFGAFDISLNWLRLDHVGSLVRCSIRDVYVGSNQIHAPAELVLENPTKLLDWIERYAVTFAWAPNFALGLLNQQLRLNSHKQWDLTSLRSMLSVAEAIIPKTAQTFVRLLAPYGFSPSVMHAAWGMSETCAAVTFSHDYLEQLAYEDSPYVEVGAPAAGFSMRIVDIHDEVVSEETIGRLQIKGPMVLSGYYENPELNESEFTGDGWFKTGDLGYIKQGKLTVTGREKDIIIINGLNHFSPEIEAIVEEVDGVFPSYTAACGLRKDGQDTDLLVVFFCSQISDREELKIQLKEIQSNVARKLGIQAAYLLPIGSAGIPKTSSGKIQRLKLKEDFDAGVFDELIQEIDLLLHSPMRGLLGQDEAQTETEKKLANIWKDVLGRKAIHRDDNFFEQGGTSVLAARLFMLIEQIFGKTLPLASLFQAPTVAQLALMVDQDLNESELWNSLVPIRREGDHPPLFFIHAGFGDVVGFESLLRYLDDGWPVYALRPIDLGGEHEPLPTIEKMADHYISEIIKEFPSGPYFLVGHCAGGSVAYEMARQLEAHGYEIGLLVMNDTTYPGYKNYLRPRLSYYDHHPLYKDGWMDFWYYVSIFIYRVQPYRQLARVHRHARALRENKTEYIKQCLEAVFSRGMRKENYPGRRTSMNEPNAPDTMATAGSLVEVKEGGADSGRINCSKQYIDERFFESFLRAEQKYVPKPYTGSVDFLLSIQNTYAAAARPYRLKSLRQYVPVKPETRILFGWDKVALGGFRVHTVDCSHESMLLESDIQLLCEALNQVLSELQKLNK